MRREHGGLKIKKRNIIMQKIVKKQSFVYIGEIKGKNEAKRFTKSPRF